MEQRVEPEPQPGGSVAVDPAGADAVVVTVAGELDTVPGELPRALDGALAAGVRHVVVDAAGLEFLDTGTISALVAAHGTLGERGGTLSLAAPPERVARVLGLTKLDLLLPVHASRSAALAAVEAGR